MGHAGLRAVVPGTVSVSRLSHQAFALGVGTDSCVTCGCWPHMPCLVANGPAATAPAATDGVLRSRRPTLQRRHYFTALLGAAATCKSPCWLHWTSHDIRRHLRLRIDKASLSRLNSLTAGSHPLFSHDETPAGVVFTSCCGFVLSSGRNSMIKSILGTSAIALVAAMPALAQEVDRTGWPTSFTVGTASQGGTFFV
jgi:hypothetical protein